ncbi:hypothetical protein TrRE_jg6421, partial [Triparma retinervis]
MNIGWNIDDSEGLSPNEEDVLLCGKAYRYTSLQYDNLATSIMTAHWSSCITEVGNFVRFQYNDEDNEGKSNSSSSVTREEDVGEMSGVSDKNDGISSSSDSGWEEEYLCLPTVRTALVNLGGGDSRDRSAFASHFTASARLWNLGGRGGGKVATVPVNLPCGKLSTSTPDATERRRNSRGVEEREVQGLWEHVVKEIVSIGGAFGK